MAFIEFLPLGQRAPQTLQTSSDVLEQLWQQLVMTRFLGAQTGYANTVEKSATFIDQAKIYFLDALKSNWRSAGLLYYYSFLNLTKAVLVHKSKSSYEELTTASTLHGIHSAPQTIQSILDFKIKIDPPSVGGRQNIFSHFYEAVTNSHWPHPKTITISLENVIGHCLDVAAESKELFGVKCSTAHCQSLLRVVGNEVWVDYLFIGDSEKAVATSIENCRLESIPEFSENDKTDWLVSHGLTTQALHMAVILQGSKRQFVDDETYKKVLAETAAEATETLTPYAFPSAFEAKPPVWLFVPEIELSDKTMQWHPLLADYLFAFALSTILRYQPHLLEPGTPSNFLAEAWCSQSAATLSRHFLMELTQPPKRLQRLG